MTFQNVADLGELVAAIATVVTLLYLAAQIRQSTELARGSQSQEHVRWRTDVLDPIVEDRQVAELWVKGGEHFDELDEVDRRRIMFFESRALSGWRHYYHMRQKGLVDDHQWKELLHSFGRLGRRQAMKAAWLESRDGYDDGYRSLMDGYILGSSGRGLKED